MRGFWRRNQLLSVTVIFLTTSVGISIPHSAPIAWIISGQCRSAADNVRKKVGIPRDRSIARTSYSSLCQYAGEPRMFFRNLYACSVRISCWSDSVSRNKPAVIFCPLSVRPLDKRIAKLASLCICWISEIYCAQKMYSMFLAKRPSTFKSRCWKYFLMGKRHCLSFE